MRRFVSLVSAVVLACAQVVAQSGERAQSSVEQPNLAAISGRVTFADGSRASSASVMLRAVGETSYMQRTVELDDDGRFAFQDVLPGVYHVRAMAPGFVHADVDLDRLYRPGDVLSITMARGAVITGTVTRFDGSPVVGIAVRADPIRPAIDRDFLTFEDEAQDSTDDRGVFRIYGLEAGQYVVGAGGPTVASLGSAFEGEARTFHPSARRDGAAILSVGLGQELTGVDIAYRGERGNRVSGTVVGAFASQGAFRNAAVILTRTLDGAVEEVRVVRRGLSTSFSFEGVADGEYLATATSGFGIVDGTWSESKTVTVRGSDVSGVVLVLQPTGSIRGKVVVDTPKAPEAQPSCKPSRSLTPDDIAVRALMIVGVDSVTDGFGGRRSEGLPHRTGRYSLDALRPGIYAIDVVLPGYAHYVASITVARPATKGSRPLRPSDASTGIRVGPGDTVENVVVTVAHGAGSLAGSVPSLARGSHLLSVFLVPTDPIHAADALRYRESRIDAGAFAFRHVAPGRYAVIVRESAQQKSGSPRPSWVTDRTTRERLKALAKSPMTETVGVAPCQNIGDLVVRRIYDEGAPKPK
jgi:hypothetical protein